MLQRVTLVLALLTPTLTHAQAHLFTDADRTALTARQADLLRHAEALATPADVQIARANPAALSEPSVTFDLAPGTSVTLQHTRTERVAAGQTLFFRGSDNGTHAVVVERSGTLTATVRVRGQLYSVRPLTGGLHAIVRVDESRFVDHPDEWEAVEQAAAERPAVARHHDAGAPASTSGSMVVQRILVPYTSRAASQVGDILGLVQLAMAETNQGYADSDVNLRLELAHVYQTPDPESNSFFTILNRMVDPSDGFHDEIPGLRAEYGADMVGMIIGSGVFCGVANGIAVDTAEAAHQVTSQSCATGYYSFAHEFGHLQGARHNVEIDDSDFPFPYGHGKCYDPGDWRTIMSYGCPGTTTRVPRWSNPDVNYLGEPLGDVPTRDNARVLDETAAMIAAFYPDPLSVSVEGTVTGGSPVAGGGGTVTFELVLSNLSSSSFSGEYWIDVFLPGGTLYGGSPVERGPGTLGAGQSATLSFSGAVPARAPGGTYTVRAYVGASYPDDIADSSDFTFSKSGSQAAGGAFEIDVRPEDGAPAAASRRAGVAAVATYPNPFSEQTTLRYEVAERGAVELTVYDVLGRSVATLAEGIHEAGSHEVVFDAGALPSGVYVWHLTSGTAVQTGRLLLAR
ncbi:MAG: M12 family metallo-peptidase [Bacteroidota bacterium]